MKPYFYNSCLVAFALSGCANAQTQRDIDQKLQTSSPVPTRQSLDAQERFAIALNRDYSAEQKTQLLDLQKTAHRRVSDLRDESSKLTKILISDMGQRDYNTSEVNALKQRIKQTEQDRVDVIFASVDKANKIIGRDAPNRLIILEEIGRPDRDMQ